MTIRYKITLGASTTAGGQVTTAPTFFTIRGVPVAYEDDAVSCPACNSVGVIKPDGPRLSDTFNGKQVALSGDLCICQCSPPPRLVENQTFSYQRIDGDWLAGQASAAAAAAVILNEAGNHASAKPDGVPLVLLDPDTDAPYRHRAYRLELQGGVIGGTTDADGATRPLTAQERAAFIRWFVVDGGVRVETGRLRTAPCATVVGNEQRRTPRCRTLGRQQHGRGRHERNAGDDQERRG